MEFAIKQGFYYEIGNKYGLLCPHPYILKHLKSQKISKLSHNIYHNNKTGLDRN